MNWQNNPLNIGIIQENKSYSFEFISTKDLNIVSVKAGCNSCTFVNGYKEGKLKVTYKSSSIPYHLGGSEQKIEKNILVTYKDKSTETLKFTATVKK